MNKRVIVINGNAGVGKDTLCDLAGKHFKIRNVSSITPIKEIALQNGWDGTKDPKSRKLLSDLKRIFTEYNDLPLKYLFNQYMEFTVSDEEIMFVHIREGNEIDRFKKLIAHPCKTLLITRNKQSDIEWGNASDDNVTKYHYDIIFDNNDTLDIVEEKFVELLNHIMQTL